MTTQLTIEQAFQKAVEAHLAGKLQDAEALYRFILQAQPKHPEANHNLGVLAVSLNKSELALPLFKTALEANPKVAEFWISYVNALIKSNQLEIARSVLEQVKKFGLTGEKIDAFEAQLNWGNTTPIAVTEKSESILQKQPSTFAQQTRKLSIEKEKKKHSPSNQTNPIQVISPSRAEVDLLLENYQQGRYDLVVNLANDITKKYPDHPFSWKVLGAVFGQTGKLQESLFVNKRVVAISPNDVEAHYNLGITLQKLGRLLDAEASYKKAIAIKPEYAKAHYDLGITLHVLGRFEDAEGSYKKSISILPDYAEAHSNLGLTLHELGRLEDAEASFKDAIAIKPDLAEAHSNLGLTLQVLGRLEEAEASFNKAIAIKPDFAEAHSNLGLMLQERCKLVDAKESFHKALAIKPEYAEAYSNLGLTLQELGRLEDAEASFNKAIAIKPEYAQAYTNLGNTLKLKGQYLDAIESIGRALQINSKMPQGLQSYSMFLALTSNFTDVIKFSDSALNYCLQNSKFNEQSKIWHNRLYNFIYHPDLSAEQICDEHKRWGSKFVHLGHGGFLDHDRTVKRRLRIGYVSPDFRGHSCRFYFEPLFASHDHTRFELFAYANVVHEDEHTHRFKSYFDHWHNILGVSDKDAAELIRKDKIDILVDGCGHMADTRLTVFAHKPAPIQLTWLGAAWTTGLPQMDYVLFDPYMGPEGTAASEQIIRLPRTWCVYRPGERATRATVKTSPAVTNGYVTFGYSGRTERLNYRVFHTWGRILKRLPQARLILDYKPFNDPKTQTYYMEFLQTHGVDTSRVIMRNSENVFEGHGDIDILLDSFPHSGGTMLFDAVWMSVPVITLASARPVGRVGTSLMTNLGLPEWVAKDEQEYEDKAVAFAQDIPALASLRNGMRARMLASSVMDEKGFAQDMEAAFETMWATWIASKTNYY